MHTRFCPGSVSLNSKNDSTSWSSVERNVDVFLKLQSVISVPLTTLNTFRSFKPPLTQNWSLDINHIIRLLLYNLMFECQPFFFCWFSFDPVEG